MRIQSYRKRNLPWTIGYLFIVFLAMLTYSILNESFIKSSYHTKIIGKRVLDQYPDDLLLEQPYIDANNKYFLILHILGTLYMFAGLAIVCDDYFVEALEEMVERYNISEDVAGATFMAAGGSAPEFFTSLMGIFVSENDVGFGTIVGSAVFNVLFVIGLCGVFAHKELKLTWWPLFRDCTFYMFSLFILVIVIADEKVHSYEAILLFFLYLLYVFIMKNNDYLRVKFTKFLSILKSQINSKVNSINPNATIVKGNSNKELNERENKKLYSSVKRNSVQHLLQHQLTISVLPDIPNNILSSDPIALSKLSAKQRFKLATACILSRKSGESKETITSLIHQSLKNFDTIENENENEKNENEKNENENGSNNDNENEDNDSDGDDEDSSIFNVPEVFSARIIYFLTFPLSFLLYLTIPHCGKQNKKQYYWITFLMSLVWISIFSYNMVWWSVIISSSMGLSPLIMGVTVLAAGTSIPDAISSVIVARRGFGDMAVSSSIGSNIFDILVGLPIPWILKTCLVEPGSYQQIYSDSLVYSVLTLLGMVTLVILSIIYTKWILGKKLGGIMFLFYIIFLIQTVLLES